MRYEERRRQVLELREQGLTQRAVAEQLGISHGHVKHVCTERAYAATLRTSREAKRRRTGTCVDCGGTTRYNGGNKPVSQRCAPCGLAYTGNLQRQKIGTGPMQQKALEFLTQPRRYMELRDHLGLSDGYTGQLLHALRRHNLVTRLSRGVYVRSEA